MKTESTVLVEECLIPSKDEIGCVLRGAVDRALPDEPTLVLEFRRRMTGSGELERINVIIAYSDLDRLGNWLINCESEIDRKHRKNDIKRAFDAGDLSTLIKTCTGDN